MPAWSFALRLLLCLVLALDGASPVVAAVHVHASEVVSAPEHASEHRACHESATSLPAGVDDDGRLAVDPDQGGRCCDRADCACACLHHAPAAASATIAGAQHRPRIDVASGVRSGHAPPPSSVQIRPPIG